MTDTKAALDALWRIRKVINEATLYHAPTVDDDLGIVEAYIRKDIHDQAKEKINRLECWIIREIKGCDSQSHLDEARQISRVNYIARKVENEKFRAALEKIASFPRGGVILEGTPAGDRDAMIEIARTALKPYA